MKSRALDPRVDAFLESAAQFHDWSSANCGFFIADYVAHRTGKDPAADLRGQLADEAAARAAIDREGNFIKLVDRRLRSAGLKRKRLQAARMGDVGLILLPTETGLEPVGAIALGAGRWAVRTSAGIRFTRGMSVARWELPCG